MRADLHLGKVSTVSMSDLPIDSFTQRDDMMHDTLPHPRRRLRAIHAALLCAGLALQAVHAADTPTGSAAEASRQYRIPSGPLAEALSLYIGAAGVTLAFDAGQLRDLRSDGLQGNFTVTEGFSRLLAGSGFEALPTAEGRWVLRRLPASTGGPTLPTVSVTASGNTVGAPPAAYAGGQVASGGRVGLLGNRRFMDTPFSQTSYTEELIRNSQASTVAEVLEYSPSVTRLGGSYYHRDGYKIRGFDMFSWDSAYDGMFGLGSIRRDAIEQLERIELLKGPSALLNGVPPFGGVGGIVNLVPKRATDAPITSLTLSYLEGGHTGGHLDVGRRFGPDNRLGARVNVAHKEGGTQLDHNSRQATLASVSLDYQGDRLRLFGNFNYQKQGDDAPMFVGYALAPTSSVPKAPDGSTNPNPPWSYTDTERDFHILRAEYDLNDDWTVSTGYGWQRYREVQDVAFTPTILNPAGDLREPGAHRLAPFTRDFRTYDLKLAGRLNTGPVSHRLALDYYRSSRRMDYSGRSVAGSGAISNIYDLVVNYARPDFDGVTPSYTKDESTASGLAIADTIGFFDDRLQLTLGIRRQNLRNENLLTGTTTYDRSATTPAAAALFKLDPTTTLYANYIEGLSEAPSPPATAANFGASFDPAKSKQTEIGLKRDIGRFAGTVALFEITRPSGITDPGTNVFAMNGEQRHRGIELEGFGEPVPGVRLIGGVTHISASMVRTQNGVNQGKRPTDVPEWVATLRGEWDLPYARGLTLTAGAVHSGSRYLDAANTQKVPDWTRFDLGARYTTAFAGQATTFRAGLSNVFDKRYWESARSSLVAGAPRTLSMSVTVDFD